MLFDYTTCFNFEEHAITQDCETWYFTGDKEIINSMFPNKYPEAIATELSIEKYAENDWLVSISPTMKDADGTIDYDWTDIELSMSTIKELVDKVNKRCIRKLVGNKSITTVGELKEALTDVPDDYTITCMGTIYILLGWNDICQNGDYISEVYGAFSTRELAREAGDELVESETIKYYTIDCPKLDEFGWR